MALIFRSGLRRKSTDRPSSDEAYKQVNGSTLGPDIKPHELHHPSFNYNYYISDRDSISEHIYEVIDDEVVKQKHPERPPVQCRCSVQCQSPQMNNKRGSNVYYQSSSGNFNAHRNYLRGDLVDNSLVTINLDKFHTINPMQSENYCRQFNSLKTFKTSKKRTFK